VGVANGKLQLLGIGDDGRPGPGWGAGSVCDSLSLVICCGGNGATSWLVGPLSCHGMKAPKNNVNDFFSEKYNININTYTRIITHLYKYIYVYSILMSTSKRSSRFDLNIHKVSY
jgi:hypothetical protein